MSKIHYLLKISIIFIILGIFSSLLPSETYLTFSSSNIAMTLSPIESLLFLYSVILCFELAAVIFSFVVNLIKKDVLISNHKFFGENDSITIIEANNNAETMVLSRNQFDEAAILIVRALGDISSGLMNNARRNLVLLRRIIGDDSIIDLLMLKIYKGEKNLDKIEGLSQKLMKSESISLVGMKAAFEVQMKKKEFN